MLRMSGSNITHHFLHPVQYCSIYTTLVTCIAQPGGSTNKLYYVFIVCVICRLILVLYICILTSLSWFGYYVKTVVLLSTIRIYSFSSFVTILPVAIQPLWMRTKLHHVCTDEVNMNESWSDSPPIKCPIIRGPVPAPGQWLHATGQFQENCISNLLHTSCRGNQTMNDLIFNVCCQRWRSRTSRVRDTCVWSHIYNSLHGRSA